jgi:menaquinone-dependent protoporphyrinogen oxidase
VFYTTTEGQTRRIAERIAAILREHDVSSEAFDIARPAASPIDWSRVRGVVVGASLHLGRHQRAAREFVSVHRWELSARPSAFFSVSLSAGSDDPAEASAARRLAEEFVKSAGWRPEVLACFAGRLAYTQYGLLKRLVMQGIARREGAPTDASRDHEFTDWAAVRRFANDIAYEVTRLGPAPVETEHWVDHVLHDVA